MSTRGPIPLGQMYSHIGPKRTRSWSNCWIWASIASRFFLSVSRACCLKSASMSGSAPRANEPSLGTNSAIRDAALP